MRHLIISTFIVLSIIFQLCVSQTRTDEKRTTRDSATGKVSVTESVIISSNEDITPRSDMIIINPLKFILFYNLSYFHKVTPSIVIGGGIQIPTLKDITGFGVSAEIRFHPSAKSPRGYYFAPNISFTSLHYDRYHTASSQLFSIGVLFGWQWFPADDFAIGLGIGWDYYVLNGSHDYFGSYDATLPALRFDIGYGW